MDSTSGPVPLVPANDVDLGGWHVASVVSYRIMNEAIVAQKTSPPSFSYKAPDGSSVEGKFGDWSLGIGGGSGTIIVSMPITSGKISYMNNTYDLVPCTVGIAVKLKFVPQPDKKDLKVLQTDKDSAVTVDSVNPSQGDTIREAVFKELIEKYLNANLDLFTMIFGAVNFDADYNLDGLSWLKPSFTSYACAIPLKDPTLDTCVFAILSLIDGEQPDDTLTDEIPGNAIPPDADAAFLVAPNKFLQHMLLTAVPYMFQGIHKDPPTKHFEIVNDGKTIMNTGKLTMNDVKVKGSDRTPTVGAKDFTIEVSDTYLIINITDCEFEYSPGIHVKLTYNARSGVSYDATKGILDLTVEHQTSTGSVAVSKGLQILEIVAGVASIVLSLVGAFGGVVSRTAAAAVTGAADATLGAAEGAEASAEAEEQATLSILKGCITGSATEIGALGARCGVIAKVALIGAFACALPSGIPLIMTAVAQGDYQKPDLQISNLTSAAVGETVIWPKQAGSFTLVNARLNGAMQFGLKQKQS